MTWTRVKLPDGVEYRGDYEVKIRPLAYDRQGRKFVVRMPKPHLSSAEWEPRFTRLSDAKRWAENRMEARAVVVLFQFFGFLADNCL